MMGITQMTNNIYKRINAVMNQVGYVKKDAVIDGKYKAVTHDMVVSMVRSAMIEHGIVCYPEQVKGEVIVYRDAAKDIKMHLYAGEYKVHFVGIDEGDEVVCIVQAHANDNGDKAPGKALTYAVKSAMLKVFNLETGIDDESREEQREMLKGITEDHKKELRALIIETNSNEEKFCKAINVAKLEELFDINFESAKSKLLLKKQEMENKNANNP